jgi:hypothetical protein
VLPGPILLEVVLLPCPKTSHRPVARVPICKRKAPTATPVRCFPVRLIFSASFGDNWVIIDSSQLPMPEPAPRTPLNCAPALNLEHQRKLAGVSLEDIAAKTKISLRFLKAIEAAEYQQLPGGIFTTSYLRQYAKAIGYDEATLLEHCERKMNPQPATAKNSRLENRTRLDRWFGITAQESR